MYSTGIGWYVSIRLFVDQKVRQFAARFKSASQMMFLFAVCTGLACC
jgi:hypothetical protein